MWNQSAFSTDGFPANDTLELPVSSYPKGQSFRVRSWKVGTSRRWLGRAAERRPPSGGVSGDPRAAELSNPCAARKGWSPLSALQPFGVWSRSHRASGALPPRPPPHQAPPSPRLGGGRTLAGRRRGRLADPGSLAAAAERSRRSRGTAASSSCGLGGDVGGKRLPPRRFQALGRCRFFSDVCALAHSPLIQTDARLPRNPRAQGCAVEVAAALGPRRRARPFAQPHRWGSPLRAGAGRGDGVLTPSPSPFSARHKPGAQEPSLP